MPKDSELGEYTHLGSKMKVANLHVVVASWTERDIHEVFAMLDPCSIDVGEANTEDIMEYLMLQMKSKFMKYDGKIQAKIMSELEKHAEGLYVYLILTSVQFGLILL